MALREPVAVYNAASNLEAAFVCQLITAAGFEAHTVEDVSQVGVWMFGTLPEIHKPQIWVEREDVEKVKPLLEDYDRASSLAESEVAERLRTHAWLSEPGAADLNELLDGLLQRPGPEASNRARPRAPPIAPRRPR